MNQRRPFIRKVIFIVIIAALLIPLSKISQPSTADSAGGKLAQLRETYNLSQINLGEIDPTSETIRWATLGWQNIACAILWDRQMEYKKKEDWTNLSATLEQISKLQPNYYSVWDFQAHNLSYNISTEFDDYHDRYGWVIKGINFFKEGQRLNDKDARFHKGIGWFISNKIGKADERIQYRRLFRDDEDYHRAEDPNRTRAERDNWLVGRWWFKKGEKLADSPNILLKTDPVLFYSQAAMSSIYHAVALEEEDGVFGDTAKSAWLRAQKDSREYEKREMPTTFDFGVRLGDLETYKSQSQSLKQSLTKLAPGVEQKLIAERIAKLTPAERKLLETPHDERTPEELKKIEPLDAKVSVTAAEIADEAPLSNRPEARRVALDLAKIQSMISAIDVSRSTVNFDYWQTRCDSEPLPETLEAREFSYRAKKESDAAHFSASKDLFEKSWVQWRKVLNRFPVLRNDFITADDLNEDIEKYRSLLKQMDLPFPKNFILSDVVALANRDVSPEELKAKGIDPNGANPTPANPAPAIETKSKSNDVPAGATKPSSSLKGTGGAPEKGTSAPAANTSKAGASAPKPGTQTNSPSSTGR